MLSNRFKVVLSEMQYYTQKAASESLWDTLL